VDAKSKMVRFLVYLMLTAVCLWGVFYAIYWRRPFGFSLIFCAIVGFVYYVIFTEPAKKEKLSKIIVVNLCFLELMNGIDVETLDEYKCKLISDYINENRITQRQITKYIPYFPDKTCRNLIESEVIYRVPQ
jgi:branched-subunit amino acid transport protein